MEVRGLYMNEELTPEVNSLYYQLRQMRRRDSSVFHRLFTRDGVIKVKKSSTGQMYSIVTEQQFNNYKRDAGL